MRGKKHTKEANICLLRSNFIYLETHAGIPLLPYASFTGYGKIKCCDWIGARAINVFLPVAPRDRSSITLFANGLESLIYQIASIIFIMINSKILIMENPFEIIIEKLNNIEALLKDMHQHKFSPEGIAAANNGVLNVQQAAKFLSISVSTVYKHTSERNIPFYTTGKRIYFRASELAEWLTKNRSWTREDIEREASNYVITHKRPM
jgi:excisionase family DNA binding protein